MNIIGIDLSINSTGLCINGEYYIIITSKMTKKQKELNSSNIEIIEYSKSDDINKNIYNIVRIILDVIHKYNITKAVIEDVAIGATFSRSLIDLTGLNYWLRGILQNENIEYVCVPPAKWKKELLGNGQADKELIIYIWKKITGIDVNIKKIDDIADSYFLSQYGSK